MMKLKKDRSGAPCDASGCKQEEGLVGYAPGVAFDEGIGGVKLCPHHIQVLEGERAAAPKVVDAAEPLAKETSLVPVQDPELAQEAADAKEVLEMVQAFQIVTQSDMDFANECVVEVKAKLKQLETKKKKATGPMNEALKEIRSWFSPAIDALEAAEKIWKQKTGQWAIAEDERQRQALAAVQEAHKAGDVQGVATAMAVAAQATVELPRNQTIRIGWRFAVDSPELVPRQFCSPDERKISPVVEALGLAATEAIPGIRIWKDADVTVRQK